MKWNRIFDFEIVKRVHRTGSPIKLLDLYRYSEKGKEIALQFSEVYHSPQISRKISVEHYVNLLEFLV